MTKLVFTQYPVGENPLFYGAWYEIHFNSNGEALKKEKFPQVIIGKWPPFLCITCHDQSYPWDRRRKRHDVAVVFLDWSSFRDS